jgi:beta-aspartyl-dipeptidase (metallo-type)
MAPDDRGTCDVLAWKDRIVDVGQSLTAPAGAEIDAVDADGRVLMPGLVDPHIHIGGASGSGGPVQRTPDLPTSRILQAGVTTVVSPLGTDSLSRSIPGLLMRAAAASEEGISAYVYTGGWRNPVPTLTGDPQADVAYIDRVLGIKVAIAEPSAPPFSAADLAHLAHAAVVGGRLAGKQAVLHVHIGDRPEGLELLREAVQSTGLPTDRFVATHVNRKPNLLAQAIEFAKAGGSVDITAQVRADEGYPDAVSPVEAVRQCLDGGVPIERITISSDGGASYPRPGGGLQMVGPGGIFETLKTLVVQGQTWEAVLPLATSSPANLLGLGHKGRVVEGGDADLVLLDRSDAIDRVWSRGRLMIEGGRPVVPGYFESPR